MKSMRAFVIFLIWLPTLGLLIAVAGLGAAPAAGQDESPEAMRLSRISEETGLIAAETAVSPACSYNAGYAVYLCSEPELTVRPQRDPAAAERAAQLLGSVGLLLIPDTGSDRIMAFDPQTGDLVDPDFIPSDSTNLTTPINAILSASGDTILVSDQNRNVVQEYDLLGNYLGVFAPAGGENPVIMANIRGIALRPNGNLLVTVGSGANDDAIAEFDTNGTYLGNFIASGSGGLDSPYEIYQRGNDWLVSGINSFTIHRYDLDSGAYTGNFAAIDDFPEQIIEAGNGNILVGNFFGTQQGVVEFSPTGSLINVYNPPELSGYRGVYELPNGNILTTTATGVHEIDRDGNLVETKLSGVNARFIEFVAPGGALIDLTKTVGTDSSACATTDTVTLPVGGGEVTYCYRVENTGGITLTHHDLVDDQLGVILSGFPYTLTPGTSTFLTQTVHVTQTTVNVATWTAYVSGTMTTTAASDTAVVTVELPAPTIVVTPTSLASSQPLNTQVTQTLTISNVGAADLHYTIIEGAPGPRPGPLGGSAAGGHEAAVRREKPVVTSSAQCAQYENYAGAEPAGYAEFCLGHVAAPAAVSRPLAPTDPGYALDVSFISDNFVTFSLNDFPGQTVVGTTADIYYGMDFDPTATTLYALNDTTHQLGTIDLATGAFTGLVPSADPAGGVWTGLTIDPVTGDFYVSNATALYSLDPTTGNATLIGPFGTPLMIDIAMNADGEMFGHDAGTDSIYQIDPTTGAATLIGPTGYSANFAQGMDFDNEDGTLYIFLYMGNGVNVYGTVNLSTGRVTPLASSNPLGEFEGATQTVSTQCRPNDIRWASVTPISGTVPVGTADILDVIFDSTGLTAGVYTGTLCIDSNDPVTPQVYVPLTLTVEPAPAIVLTKTVGLEPDSCATTNTLDVVAGTTVYYCYTVTNNGNVPFPFHDLVDDQLGTILDDFAFTLNPGDSLNTVTAGLTISATVTADTTNTATWTAYEDESVTASATASATVTISVSELYLPFILKP